MPTARSQGTLLMSFTASCYFYYMSTITPKKWKENGDEDENEWVERREVQWLTCQLAISCDYPL